MRSLLIFAFGCCLAAGSLTACGGSHTTSVVPQSQQVSSGKPRKTQSLCPPDEYGYCIQLTGTSHSDGFAFCPPYHHREWNKWSYELYYNYADQGAYVRTVSFDTCQDAVTWDPGDPAVVTGDPNLP
jgi:hypothetical protein